MIDPKPAPFTPRPAQPLTLKRRTAITKYAQIRHMSELVGGVAGIVENTLTADRMQAEKLYAWLGRHGYTYDKKQWRLKR